MARAPSRRARGAVVRARAHPTPPEVARDVRRRAAPSERASDARGGGGAHVGYGVIDHNNLYADVHDFEGRAGTVSEAIDAAARLKLGDWVPPFNLTGVRGIAAWFIASGAMTAATAARGDFASHRRWAARHVGAGLWVAAQRPVYSAIRAGAVGLGFIGAVDDPSSSAAFADAFYIASYITTFAYFGAAEWAARGEWREDEERANATDG